MVDSASPPRLPANCTCAAAWRREDRLLVDPEKITFIAENQSKGKNSHFSDSRYPDEIAGV